MTSFLESAPVFTPSDRALRRRAITGAVAALPAVCFVGASVLKYGLGFDVAYDPIDAMTSTPDRQRAFNAITPFVFIGGLATAWALNFYPLVRLRAMRDSGAVIAHLRVSLRPFNLVVATVAGCTMGLLLGYLFLENLHHLRRGIP